MVTVMPFAQTGVVPSLGHIVGNSGREDLMASLSQKWSGGVVFGNNDPLQERYRNWTQTVLEPVRAAGRKVKEIASAAHQKHDIREITSEEQLDDIPVDMWEPIVTDPVIRHHVEKGDLYGFGLDLELLPKEDDVGRLCENGAVDSWKLDSTPDNKPVYFTWEWRSGDPEYSLEELDKIRRSREFIRDVMLADMENLERDPTDPSDADVG